MSNGIFPTIKYINYADIILGVSSGDLVYWDVNGNSTEFLIYRYISNGAAGVVVECQAVGSEATAFVAIKASHTQTTSQEDAQSKIAAKLIQNTYNIGLVKNDIRGLDSASVSVVTVTTSVTNLPSSPLSSRTNILVKNVGTIPVFLGFTVGLTASNGFKLAVNESVSLDINSSVILKGVVSSGSSDVHIIEIGKS